mmetsp:Transcript_79894/g.158787  ORF Transcript_79894/g.158787 Transcript_79894/m.158787 type:complete len:452 (-) Transcript_79894:202-1557(-)
MWMHTNGHPQAGHVFYSRALEVLPGNEVLTLAYARVQEADGNAAAARQLLEKLLGQKTSPLVFIHLMRLARRSEGVDSCRRVFARARRSEGCTWQVYAAAAQLEYQMGTLGGGFVANPAAGISGAQVEEGAVVASRILMLALDRYEGDAQLALHCVRFLVERNDVANARAVLERALPMPDCAASRELWRAYLDLEMTFGSVASVRAVGERRAAAHPELRVDSLHQLAALHSYCGLWPVEARLLDAMVEPQEVTPMANQHATPLGVGGGSRGSIGGGGGGGGAIGIGGDGGGREVARSGFITMPQLDGLVVYTGQSIEINGPTLAGDAAADETPYATAIPRKIDELLEALPLRTFDKALTKPTNEEVQTLFTRLAHLPEQPEKLPAAAAAFSGSAAADDDDSAAKHALPAASGRGAVGQAGIPGVANQRPRSDPFTSRQKIARAHLGDAALI